jgi:molecular chaperone DnaK (HSP70)
MDNEHAIKLGIDFGTTLSWPAGKLFKHRNEHEILLRSGHKIPSLFYYRRSRSEILVGSAADREIIKDPNTDNLMRDIKLNILNSEETYEIGLKKFSLKEIISSIFKEIVIRAKEAYKENHGCIPDIEGAVISIPTLFGMKEMKLLRDALESSEANGGAGVKWLGFIREPVSAAISYFNAPNSNEIKDGTTVLVYDFGGGTCDIAIVRSDKNSDHWYNVLASDMVKDSNNNPIGGKNWDEALVNIIKQKLKISQSNNRQKEAIRREAIEVKHVLTNSNKAVASVATESGTIDCEISISEFNRATAKLLDRTIDVVKKVVNECKTRIDYIVLAGGSSWMKQVDDAFQLAYPMIPRKLHNPEKAIAIGAAIYAEHLLEPQFLGDICKFSYGIGMHSKNNSMDVDNLIIKGTHLPVSATWEGKVRKDGQEWGLIPIVESESSEQNVVYSKKMSRKANVIISDMENAFRGDTFVVEIKIDRSSWMHVVATEEKTGKSINTKVEIENDQKF